MEKDLPVAFFNMAFFLYLEEMPMGNDELISKKIFEADRKNRG